MATNNSSQAAARDETRAAAIETFGQMADEALKDLLSPQPVPVEVRGGGVAGD
jgi:hypothetical protein